MGILIWRFHRIKERIKNDPKKLEYMDLALTPVVEHNEEELDLVEAYGDQIPLMHITKKKPVAVE